jgi:hypothetical protein
MAHTPGTQALIPQRIEARPPSHVNCYIITELLCACRLVCYDLTVPLQSFPLLPSSRSSLHNHAAPLQKPSLAGYCCIRCSLAAHNPRDVWLYSSPPFNNDPDSKLNRHLQQMSRASRSCVARPQKTCRPGVAAQHDAGGSRPKHKDLPQQNKSSAVIQ